MNFNGKKFSELILEQDNPTKPMPDKKGPGWKESEGGKWVWDEKTNDWIWELPEVTVTARSDKHRVVIQISDDGKVEDVRIGL
jgi:hypothetical protein